MLIIAFFGLLRISEYCDGGLRMADVRLYQWGIQLTIPFSKTSTEPVTLRISARGDNDVLCPVRALRGYISFLPQALLASPAAPLFVKDNFSPAAYTAGTFEHRIHELVSVVLQRDPARYAGHSLRRGGATALYIAGVPEVIIQQHGRWRSLAVRTYMSSSSYHQLAPTILLLKHTHELFRDSTHTHNSHSHTHNSASASSSNHVSDLISSLASMSASSHPRRVHFHPHA